MATSVASEARFSTFDCTARPKHIPAIPQITTTAPSSELSREAGSKSSRQIAMTAIAAIRKPLG